MSYKTIKAEPNNGNYLETYAGILVMEERYADAKTYIDQALKNRDSTADNSTVLEHAGDIYYMNGTSCPKTPPISFSRSEVSLSFRTGINLRLSSSTPSSDAVCLLNSFSTSCS